MTSSPGVDVLSDSAPVAEAKRVHRGPRHIVAPGNPRLWLHQEHAMRTGGYDRLARLSVHADTPLPDGTFTRGPDEKHTTFAVVVDALGVDAAVRAVSRCSWLTESDWARTPPEECVECVEVARS